MPSDGNRWELFDGEAYLTPAPTHRHQKVLGRLYSAFDAAIRDGSEVVFAPFDVVLARATAVQPDLTFIQERNLGILGDAARGAPDLVLEVLSPSTAVMDRGIKMETYARHGIGEYWIADIERKTLEIHRLDREAGAYALVATCGAGDRATTPLLPELAIDPADLFR